MKLRKFVSKSNEELKMDEIRKRLELCKQYLEAEYKAIDPSKVYIDDLQSSIAFFEKQLDIAKRGGTINIIDGAI